VRRGTVVGHALRDRRFVVVSCQAITDTGTAVVVEIADTVPAGARGMLAVPLTEEDPVPGAVLVWRINYVSADRLGAELGQLSESTVERLDMALRAGLVL
jgi:mRNA-degrading endonuclease toxin of MazEF toxin-antitoxin module